METRYGIRIGAKDETQSVLRSALNRFTTFGKAAAVAVTGPFKAVASLTSGLARIGMASLGVQGIRQAVGQLDNLIDRGARLDLVRRSFESLTGRAGAQADQFARKMVNASNGVLRIADAMEVVNVGLAAGLKTGDIETMLDFVSKKALSTGQNVSDSLRQLMHGLATGQPRGLEELGLLNNRGLAGVSSAFDQSHGKGAFDALDPMQQKAEITRAVLEDMRLQMNKLGVSGREIAFTWTAIKSEMGDAVDRLALGVAKAEKVQDALRSIRTMMAGIAEHLDKGGSIGDVLLGKKGADGKEIPGLLDIAKSGFQELAVAAGKRLAAELLRSTADVVEAFSRLGGSVGEWGTVFAQKIGAAFKAVGGLWEEWKPKLIDIGARAGTAFIDKVHDGVDFIVKALIEIDWIGLGKKIAEGLKKYLIDNPINLVKGIIGLGNDRAEEGAALEAEANLVQKANSATVKKTSSARMAARNRARTLLSGGGAPSSLAGALLAMSGAAVMGQSATSPLHLEPNNPLAKELSGKADEIEGSISFKDTKAKIAAFKEAYAGKGTELGKYSSDQLRAALHGFASSGGLSPAELRDAQTQQRRLEHQLGVIDRGGAGVRQRAMRAAGTEITALRRRGFHRPDLEARIREFSLEQETQASRKGVQDSLDRLRGATDPRHRLTAGQQRRMLAEGTEALRSGNAADIDGVMRAIDGLMKEMTASTQAVHDLVGTLGGASRRIANARP